MASSVSKMIQSLRSSMSRLMGRPRAATQTVEIQNKAIPKTDVTSSPTSYKPVPPHNPFTIKADHPKIGDAEQSGKTGDISTQAEHEFQTARNSLGAYKTPVQLQGKPQKHVNETKTQIKDCDILGTSENILLQTPLKEESSTEVEPKKNERVEPGQDACLTPVSPSSLGLGRHLNTHDHLDVWTMTPPSTSICIKPVLKFESMTPSRQVIGPHIPMIRFRKGALPIVENVLSTQVDPKTEAGNAQENEEELVFSSVPGSQQWKAAPIVHEWWETPEKFKRRQLDEVECDIINGGGCDKIYT